MTERGGSRSRSGLGLHGHACGRIVEHCERVLVKFVWSVVAMSSGSSVESLIREAAKKQKWILQLEGWSCSNLPYPVVGSDWCGCRRLTGAGPIDRAQYEESTVVT